MSDESDRLAVLAKLFGGLGNRTRLAVLLAVADQRSMTAVAEDVGVSRTSVQDQIENLVDRRLVYRPGETGYPYALTPFGEFFVVFVREHDDVLVEGWERVPDAEEQARNDLEGLVSGDALERAVTQRMWELVADELVEQLELADATDFNED